MSSLYDFVRENTETISKSLQMCSRNVNVLDGSKEDDVKNRYLTIIGRPDVSDRRLNYRHINYTLFTKNMSAY